MYQGGRIMAARQQSDIVQIKLRLKEQLRARIEENAQIRGVSINSEIVNRLERSLIEQDVLYENSYTRKLLQTLAGAISIIEHQTGKRWIDDADTFSKALLSIYGILGQIGPISHEEVKALLLRNRKEDGLVVAKALLRYAGIPDNKIEEIMAAANEAI
jgi:hypothetical protein